MEVVKILQQLGMDGTVFIQFLIFCVIYFISAPLFMKKLQYVLEHREEKTTVLKKHAEETIERAKKIDQEYADKIDEVRIDAQKDFHLKKQNKASEEQTKIKGVEEQLNKEYEEARTVFVQELDGKKNDLLKQTDELSDHLIQRLS